MTVAPADGVVGLEGRHVWLSYGQPQFELVLNEPYLEFSPPPSPFFIIDQMPGFRSFPEADDPRAVNTSRLGETAYPVNPKGKTYTIEGRIMSDTIEGLRQGEGQMLRAFAERRGEGVFRHQPIYPHGVKLPDPAPPDPPSGVGDTEYWYSFAKPLQLEMDESLDEYAMQAPWSWRKKFLLGMRMSDPRFYWWQSTSSDGTASTPATVVNFGNAPTDPVITVVNSTFGATIRLVKDAADSAIDLQIENVPTGTLTVDFHNRTITHSLGLDLRNSLNSTWSRWWWFGRRGIGPLETTQVYMTGGDTFSVTWSHASW